MDRKWKGNIGVAPGHRGHGGPHTVESASIAGIDGECIVCVAKVKIEEASDESA